MEKYTFIYLFFILYYYINGEAMKKISKYLVFVLIIGLFLTMNVYAATSGEINICSYSGTVRTFKIIGLVIKVTTIVVPIIMMIVTIIGISKTVLSGDSGDISKHISLFIKRFIAGVAVFLLPVVFDYIFNELVSNDTNKYKTCTVCMLDPSDCKIPEKDPEIQK